LWIGAHQHLLRTIGLREPDREAVVMVMVGGDRELLAAYKPRRLAMAELLGYVRQRNACLAQALDCLRVA